MGRTVVVTGGAPGDRRGARSRVPRAGRQGRCCRPGRMAEFSGTTPTCRAPGRARPRVRGHVHRTNTGGVRLDRRPRQQRRYLSDAAVQNISPEEWDRVIATNLTSVFHLSQLVIPSMKANAWGRIINIASNTVFMGTPNLVHYAASKGAIIGLSRSLATREDWPIRDKRELRGRRSPAPKGPPRSSGRHRRSSSRS